MEMKENNLVYYLDNHQRLDDDLAMSPYHV
jgi:hypothetical protein